MDHFLAWKTVSEPPPASTSSRVEQEKSQRLMNFSAERVLVSPDADSELARCAMKKLCGNSSCCEAGELCGIRPRVLRDAQGRARQGKTRAGHCVYAAICGLENYALIS